MTYSKPELTVLGEAARIIQGTSKLTGQNLDPDGSGNRNYPPPAYELDE
jgi:hypothetical protein